MAATTLTTVSSMLKEFYGVALQETMNNEVNLLKYIQKSDRAWDGLRVNYPVHTSRNVGVGARAENGALPTASYQGIESVYVTSAYVYGRINLSGPSMKGAGKNAFATALVTEMEGVKTDLVFDVARQTYGEGLGVLAETGLTSCACEISFKNRWFDPGQPGARYMQVEQQFSLGTATAPTEITQSFAMAIVSIALGGNSGANCATDTVTVSASVDTVSACKMYAFSYGGGASAGIEIKGLRAIVDDHTR